MSTKDYLSKRSKQQKQPVSPIKSKNQNRANKLKQIDAIYKSQIQQIYSSQSPNHIDIKKHQIRDDKSTFSRKPYQNKYKTVKIGAVHIDDIQNISTSSRALQSVVSQQKIKSSKYITTDSGKAVDLLKIENQNKDRKIRDLTNKCEYLLEKLRNHLSVNQFSQELQSLNSLVENKIQRFENLFKIKNQETFFKIKLQVISLLQQFDICQQQLTPLNEIQTESSLFAFMSKKIKMQLKNFRSRDQQKKFEIQKDKVLNEKLEERLTYLTETIELLKISEQKLKQKNQSLKIQMHEFLQKMKQKQLIIEQKDSQIFRLKRESQELISNTNKVQQIERNFKSDQEALSQKFQIREKEYKTLLNSQNIQKKKLQAELQEKDSLIQQIFIKEKFLAQENQRINRELLRIKERYEWCERQLENKRKEFDEGKASFQDQFRKYKENNNESMLLYAKAETEEAMRKIQEYQEAYTRISYQLQEERKTSQIKYQEYLNKLQAVQESWLSKTKRLQQIREEELQQISKDYEQKHQLLRREFEIKQKNIVEQIQAKMKTMLAQKDKKYTQKLMILEQQNETLKKEIEQQQELISMYSNKK